MKNYKLSPVVLLLVFLISVFSLATRAQNQAGAPDPSFGTNGEVITPPPPAFYRTDLDDIFLQSNGKILALGRGDSASSGDSRIYGALYNSNGSLDSQMTFALPSLAPGRKIGVRAVVIQPDGKLIFGGTISKNNCFPYFCHDLVLVRYHSHGAVDTSFGENGVVINDLDSFEEDSEGSANHLLLQPDGKIIVVGTRFSVAYGGNYNDAKNSFAILRYNPDGTPDASFGNFGLVTAPHVLASNHPYSGVLQPDGKLLVTGVTEVSYQHKRSVLLVRYNADGSLDSSFAAGGVLRLAGNAPDSLIVEPDGQILWLLNSKIYRIQQNGELDSTFLTQGLMINDGVVQLDDFAFQSDGKIIAGGRSYSPGFQQLNPTVVRFLANGELDTTFGNGGISIKLSESRFYGERIRLQPDGKIILAGEINRTMPDSRFILLRFMGDTSFFEQQTEKSRKPSLLTGLD